MGMRIQRIRMLRGMTQAQLADKAGVSRAYLATLELKALLIERFHEAESVCVAGPPSRIAS